MLAGHTMLDEKNFRDKRQERQILREGFPQGQNEARFISGNLRLHHQDKQTVWIHLPRRRF